MSLIKEKLDEIYREVTFTSDKNVSLCKLARYWLLTQPDKTMDIQDYDLEYVLEIIQETSEKIKNLLEEIDKVSMTIDKTNGGKTDE